MGMNHLDVKVFGKRSGHVPVAGENSSDSIAKILEEFLNVENKVKTMDTSDAPKLPVRPPVLCAGCPHRASFYDLHMTVLGK